MVPVMAPMAAGVGAGVVNIGSGEGWRQIAELALALGLSALIGLEREFRQKSAGLRTHTLVGVGAAVFVLISKYGFEDVVQPGRVVLDPSRVAAQIVTGVGFLGAGIIFVRRDAVRGLTTAAAIWVTAAVGACVGSGLPVLAVLTTLVYGIVTLGFPPVAHRLTRSSPVSATLRIRYPDGRGILRGLLEEITSRGFSIEDISTDPVPTRRSDGRASVPPGPSVEVVLHLHGRASLGDLAVALDEMPEVEGVSVDGLGPIDE